MGWTYLLVDPALEFSIVDERSLLAEVRPDRTSTSRRRCFSLEPPTEPRSRRLDSCEGTSSDRSSNAGTEGPTRLVLDLLRLGGALLRSASPIFSFPSLLVDRVERRLARLAVADPKVVELVARRRPLVRLLMLVRVRRRGDGR